jgi:hypothetical protein
MVKKGIFAMLALVLIVHAGFGCGVARAEAGIATPCCGPNCPFPSSAGDRACCEMQNSGDTEEVVSAKPSIPSFQPLAGSIRPYVVMRALSGFERASALQHSPPRAAKLALLCSRQI